MFQRPCKVYSPPHTTPFGRQQPVEHDTFNDGAHAGVLMPDGATMADLVRASLLAVPERKL